MPDMYFGSVVELSSQNPELGDLPVLAERLETRQLGMQHVVLGRRESSSGCGERQANHPQSHSHTGDSC